MFLFLTAEYILGEIELKGGVRIIFGKDLLKGDGRDVLEHFDDGGPGGEAAGARMDVGRLGEYLLQMVGHAVVRGSAGQSTKSWCVLP